MNFPDLLEGVPPNTILSNGKTKYAPKTTTKQTLSTIPILSGEPQYTPLTMSHQCMPIGSRPVKTRCSRLVPSLQRLSS